MSRYYDSNDNFSLADEREGMFNSRESYADYQNGMNYFHGRLSRLYSTLYVIDRLRDYPRDLFGRHTLFRLLLFNLSENVVVSLYSLTTDRLSFKFKDFISKLLIELVKDEHKTVFKRRLSSAKSKNTKDIEKRVRRLRNEAFAHTNQSWLNFKGDNPPIEDTVGFSELRELTDKLDDQYEAVNIGIVAKDVPEKDRRLIFKRPSQEFSKYELHRETDHLLKSFANIGGMWDMPETLPVLLHTFTNEQIQRFNSFRTGLGGPHIVLTREQIDEINRYRRMFGKPDYEPPQYGK
jgi:hypothetical protein